MYEYIRAIVDCGELRWEYKLKAFDVSGSMSHDEDVSEWSDEDIKTVTRMMLDVNDDDPVEIEVQWV